MSFAVCRLWTDIYFAISERSEVNYVWCRGRQVNRIRETPNNQLT